MNVTDQDEDEAPQTLRETQYHTAVFANSEESTIIAQRDNRFAPELLVISAGFDAHRADPLAQLLLDTEDFAWLTQELVRIADRHCQGRIVSVLEGG